MIRKRLILLTLALAAVFVSLGGQQVYAADKKASGVTLSPVFQQIDVLQNQTNITQNFTLANNDNTVVTFTVSAIDMGSLDDTGGVVFSGLTADYANKYGLANWIRIDQKTVTIAGNSNQIINFDIVNDATLSPGGHYGAIVINPITDIKPVKNQIQFDPQAASLLFVRKIGGETYKLSVKSPPPSRRFWNLASRQSLNFRNDGNVHVVPRGVVTIRDPFGHIVQKGVINPASSLILPERNRTYTVNLTSFKRLLLWPGRYKVETSYRYDGNQKLSTINQSIVFINLPLLLACVLLLACLAILFKGVKRRHAVWLVDKAKSFLPIVRPTTLSRPKINSLSRNSDIKNKNKHDEPEK